MKRQKRVAAIHDISCMGKCSLTAALPIISAAGIETNVIPTAVLSTHTGGFTDFTYRDLSEDILLIASHWQSLGVSFDAVYTGYLGSFEQLHMISMFIDLFKTKENIILMDPVMADNGFLYQSFPEDFPIGMKRLCEKADVIVPNITEALFLLGEPYQDGPYTPAYIEGLLKKLSCLGARHVVLTGVYYDNVKLGAATYCSETGHIGYAFTDKIEGIYHGTGDIFASVLLSAMLNNFDMSEASQIAADFTMESIVRTKDAGTDPRFGVNFEAGLPKFMQTLQL